MGNGILEKAAGRPAGTILDRLDIAGVTLTVETVEGDWPAIRRDGVTIAEMVPDFTTLADELARTPSVVRRWADCAPLAERYRRCGIDVPEWMEHETARA